MNISKSEMLPCRPIHSQAYRGCAILQDRCHFPCLQKYHINSLLSGVRVVQFIFDRLNDNSLNSP